MKKMMFIVGIILLISTGCSKEVIDTENLTESSESEVSIHVDVNDEQGNTNQVSSLPSQASTWTETLRETHELSFDLNNDNQEDVIYISYEEKEGSPYIKKFEVKVSGSDTSFVIEDYDASFEKLETIDFDKDSTDELLILFDTHGGGGQGTHDIFVLSIENGLLYVYNIKSVINEKAEIDASWNIDDPYTFEKVLYNETEEILIRQYVWDEQGHSNHIGDLISIISFSKENNNFFSKNSWMEVAK